MGRDPALLVRPPRHAGGEAVIGLLRRPDATELTGPPPPPPYPRGMGCRACDVLWVDDELCWMCGEPGVATPRPSLGYMGLVPMGMSVAINRARANGPVLSDDPAGGGPL